MPNLGHYFLQEIQYNILQNYDVILTPIEYITFSNGLCSWFDVDFDLYYDFFKQELNKVL